MHVDVTDTVLTDNNKKLPETGVLSDKLVTENIEDIHIIIIKDLLILSVSFESVICH